MAEMQPHKGIGPGGTWWEAQKDIGAGFLRRTEGRGFSEGHRGGVSQKGRVEEPQKDT